MTPTIKKTPPINLITIMQIRDKNQVKKMKHCKIVTLKRAGEAHSSKNWTFLELGGETWSPQ